MTRMWMVPPDGLCRQHLLGEHKEVHQLLGSLKAGHSIDGYLERGQVEPQNIKARHDRLAEEMIRRGYNHQSPLTVSSDLSLPSGTVDVDKSRQDLRERCETCNRRSCWGEDE